MAKTAQSAAEIARQGANICALAAFGFEHAVARVRRLHKRQAVDRHWPLGELDEFAFTGEIKQVTFDIAPNMSDDDRQALHELAEQALAAHAASA